MSNNVPQKVIESKIYEVRGSKTMLDKDLAEVYGVELDIPQEHLRNMASSYSPMS